MLTAVSNANFTDVIGCGLAVARALVRFFSGTLPIIPVYSLRT